MRDSKICDFNFQVDLNEAWTIPVDGGYSKAKWTPYAGRSVRGRVRTVVIRGTTIFMDGEFLQKAPFGQNVRLLTQHAELEQRLRDEQSLCEIGYFVKLL